METTGRPVSTRLPGGAFTAALLWLFLLAVGGIVFIQSVNLDRSAPYLLGTGLATALVFASIWAVAVNQLAAVKEADYIRPLLAVKDAEIQALIESLIESRHAGFLTFERPSGARPPDGVETAAIVEQLRDPVFEGTDDPVTATELGATSADDFRVEETADNDEIRDPIRLVPTSLPELLIRTQMQVQPLAQARQVELNLFTLPLTADVDRTRVSDALEVLLQSAIARSTEGSVVDVSLQQWENDAVFFVTDFGNQTIQEPLPSESETPIGWDLGWDAARITAAQHGGSVGVTNLDGKARLAWLRLPMCTPVGHGPRNHAPLAHQSYVH